MMAAVTTFFIVLFIVLLVGGLFAAIGARGPWPGMIWFFLILFIGTWTLGTWVRPIGPMIWNVPWLTFLMGAILIALLIAAATPRHGGRSRLGSHDESPLEGDSATTSAVGTHHHLPRDPGDATTVATALGVFFWIFVLVAIALFVIGSLSAPVIPLGD
jgi:hypothetical protein